MRRSEARVAPALVALAVATLAASAAIASPAPITAPGAAATTAVAPARRADLDDGLAARLEGTRLVVSAVARDGEDWDALAARALLDPAKGPALQSAAGAGSTTPTPGAAVDLPLALWPAGLGARALLALFPGDAVDASGWRHVVTPGATPWSLAVLFTGSGRLHAQIRDAHGAPAACRVGEIVVVDAAVLRPELHAGGAPAREAATPAPATSAAVRLVLDAARRAIRQAQAQAQAPVPPAAPDDASSSEEVPAEASDDEADGADASSGSTLLAECAPIDGDDEADSESEAASAESPAAEPPAEVDAFVPEAGSRSDDGLLRYEVDAQGPHAVYRLKQGETLYTHVVLRFTGLLSGREVNAAAQRLAKRSGIEDVTDMPVGAAVRIPFGDLLPQYLPPGHPRRLRWEEEQAASERLAGRERRHNLQGVHVLVDSGHGGLDPGAGNGVAWEDDHVYDIACRVMAVLADRTHAIVHPLVRDRSSGHAPLARLVRDTDEDLLTTPATRLEDVSTRVAVNMRWMMANDTRRRLAAQGVGDERIVFVSIHADSLHESATGAMAYFPSAELRSPTCALPADAATLRVREADDRNAFAMTRREALRAEGLSRDLGESIIASARAGGIAVHGFGPVRGSIRRGGLMVPAVLKYNRIPASVLIEACNLNNPGDRRSLRDPVYRQRFAEAIVAGLVQYFEGRATVAQRGAVRR